MTPPLYLTACGVVTPLGRGKSEVAQMLFAGRSDALTEREGFIKGRPVIVGAVTGELPSPPASLKPFDSRNNRLMQAALDEILPLVARAIRRHGRDRIAVVLGTSTSGISDGEAALAAFRHENAWPEDFDYRCQETGSLAEFAARSLGLTGPAYTVATACSSSVKAFASARRLIRAGLADAAIVGGADTLCRMTVNGFGALEALSKSRCNPFSANRDGITIGEGAAAFLMEREPGAVELLGVGETSDAHHATAPDPDGAGAREAMSQALRDAGLNADDIAYINLHGTGTLLNDAMESKAVAAVFGAVPCSSSKGMTGHMLGAAGACEAAFLWLALDPECNPAALLPPHVWDGARDPALPLLNFAPIGSRMSAVRGRRAMLSNSFGFGGSNVSLILARDF